MPDEILPDSRNTATQHPRFQTSGFTIQTGCSWRDQAPPRRLPAQWKHRRTTGEAMQPWPCQVTAASFVLGDQQGNGNSTSNSNSRAQPALSQPGAAEGAEGASRRRNARPDSSVGYVLAASDREPGIVPLVTLGSVFTLIKEGYETPYIAHVSLYEGRDSLQTHGMRTPITRMPLVPGSRQLAQGRGRSCIYDS